MPSYDSVDTREPALACLCRGEWRDGRVLRGRELVYRQGHQGPGSNDDSGQSSASHTSSFAFTRSLSIHFHHLTLICGRDGCASTFGMARLRSLVASAEYASRGCLVCSTAAWRKARSAFFNINLIMPHNFNSTSIMCLVYLHSVSQCPAS
jgi:hypothetical protein